MSYRQQSSFRTYASGFTPRLGQVSEQHGRPQIHLRAAVSPEALLVVARQASALGAEVGSGQPNQSVTHYRSIRVIRYCPGRTAMHYHSALIPLMLS